MRYNDIPLRTASAPVRERLMRCARFFVAGDDNNNDNDDDQEKQCNVNLQYQKRAARSKHQKRNA